MLLLIYQPGDTKKQPEGGGIVKRRKQATDWRSEEEFILAFVTAALTAITE